MASPASGFPAYAIRHSPEAVKSRKVLPQELLPVLFEIIDMLAENPDARPDRTKDVSRNGQVRLYVHPRPALEVTYEIDRDEHTLYLLHFVAPRVPVAKPVFVSYSHVDADWLVKLSKFLRPLEEQELVRVWDDRAILAGADWRKEIRQSLESARVALFLVTQDFLASEFIRDQEVPPLLDKAESEGCQILWIAVKSSTVKESRIARYQALNSPEQPLEMLSEAEQNRVFVQIFDRMKKAVQAS